MLKALLKKQLTETLSLFGMSAKRGKRRSPMAIAGLALLFLYAFGAVGTTFFLFAQSLCKPFVESGLTWVYFAIMGIMAMAFACIGSIFTAKTRLFEAKDNELLLSMPVPTWMILFTRIFSLYLFTLLFTTLVFLPAIVQYFLVTGFQLIPALCLLLITLLLPLGALTVCCLLGWLVALVTTKVRAKNFLTILITLLFLVAYFYGYAKINEGLQYLLANGEAVGEAIRSGLFVFRALGVAATGDLASLAIFAVIFIGLFAAVYLLLSKTFLYILTVRRGEEKRKYVAREHKTRSVLRALTAREGMRFVRNPMVGLNCFMGTLLLVVFPVLALFNLDFCRQIAASSVSETEVGAILSALLCFIASSNVVTASSVSLEGESLWIVRSMPVETKDLFKAKIALHLLLTLPFVLLTGIILCVLLRVSVWIALLAILLPWATSLFCATVGLAINLKFPNLHWTNELVAVKQSFSPMIALFLGWGVSALLVGGWFLFGRYLGAGYLGLMSAALLLASALVWRWLRGKGTELFEKL